MFNYWRDISNSLFVSNAFIYNMLRLKFGASEGPACFLLHIAASAKVRMRCSVRYSSNRHPRRPNASQSHREFVRRPAAGDPRLRTGDHPGDQGGGRHPLGACRRSARLLHERRLRNAGIRIVPREKRRQYSREEFHRLRPVVDRVLGRWIRDHVR